MEETNKHVVELQQRNINITQRNAIWESICEKVNKRRRQDRRRRTKEKIAHNCVRDASDKYGAGGESCGATLGSLRRTRGGTSWSPLYLV